MNLTPIYQKFIVADDVEHGLTMWELLIEIRNLPNSYTFDLAGNELWVTWQNGHDLKRIIRKLPVHPVETGR